MDAQKIYLKLAQQPTLVAQAQQVKQDLAAVHRKPPVLRKTEIIVGESALRGAKSSTLLDGHEVDVEKLNGTALGAAISAYSVLVPPGVNAQAHTWLRAPSQVLARLDVVAGGQGFPANPAGIRGLTQLVIGPQTDLLAIIAVHLAIETGELFGPRSPLIARVAARLHAIATGVDPIGLAVPEVYLYRHRNQELSPTLLLDAWSAGCAEGRAIVEAA